MSWVFIALSVLLAGPDAPVPECAGCHPSQVRAHASSRHAVAWVNPIFAAEYNDHPKAWCVSCHAPEVAGRERAGPPAAIAELGVTCTSCHGPLDQLVSRTRSPFSIHGTRVDESFADAASCARCHQFNFPILDGDVGELVSTTSEPMQKTAAETAEHFGESTRCTSCHDPHRAKGSHDLDTVRAAMRIGLCRDSASVRLSIENVGAGHNLPTGGVHRYMSARLWRSSSPTKFASMRLGREFATTSAGARRTITDTTVPPGKRRDLLVAAASLGGHAVEPINLEVRYHYSLDHDARRIDGTSAVQTLERRRARFSSLMHCDD